MAFCPVERSSSARHSAESPSAATFSSMDVVAPRSELFQFHEQVGVLLRIGPLGLGSREAE